MLAVLAFFFLCAFGQKYCPSVNGWRELPRGYLSIIDGASQSMAVGRAEGWDLPDLSTPSAGFRGDAAGWRNVVERAKRTLAGQDGTACCLYSYDGDSVGTREYISVGCVVQPRTVSAPAAPASRYQTFLNRYRSYR